MNRRSLLRATAATAAPVAPDAALIEAEREVAELLAAIDDLPGHEDVGDGHPLWDRFQELEGFIAGAEPKTIAGAAVKLRRLLDASAGLASGEGDSDIPSLCQVLVLLERFAAEAGLPLPPNPRPLADQHVSFSDEVPGGAS